MKTIGSIQTVLDNTDKTKVKIKKVGGSNIIAHHHYIIELLSELTISTIQT